MPILRTRLLLPLMATAVMFSQAPASFGQSPKPAEKRANVTVYYLKHAVAGETAKMIRELYGSRLNVRIAADPRTNALFVQVPDNIRKEFEQLLKVLDGEVGLTGRDEIKVFTLMNADATDMARIVSELIGKDVKIVTQPRTNSIIATGPKERLAVVEAILLRMDESKGRRRETVRVMQLQHASVGKVMRTLTDLGLLDNEVTRIATDPGRQRLLVKASDRTFKTVQDLVRGLDVAAETEKRLQMRIVWLVDEKLSGRDAASPSKDLDGVVQVLKEKLGMGKLKVAAQMLVSINPDDAGREAAPGNEIARNRFDARGTAQLSDSAVARLQATGRIVGWSGSNPVVEIEIQATGASQSAGKGADTVGQAANEQLASLTTKIAAPPGHFVVLGVTPIRSANSVFVLQVLPDLSAGSNAK